MVYLDYSATTPVNEEVLDSFAKVSKEYIGNPNSLHLLGVNSKRLMDQATKQVAELLGVDSTEVILTSGATESNNLAILGVLEQYAYRGKRILTTELEHSSVLDTLEYAKTLGFQVEYIPLLKDGTIDLEQFQKIMSKDTILVSVAMVSSEVGILQPILEIGRMLEEYPTTLFHVDGTQAIGKIKVSLEKVDLFSFSAHKFYGLKGIGCLVKRNKVTLTPLIHGGKSQTIYRSGTPPLALIVSLAKALRLVLKEEDEHYQKVSNLNQMLILGLQQIEGVCLNSGNTSIPHIINISVPGTKAETLLHALEQKEIYISTKTACSKDSGASLSLLALKKEESIALSSLRISLSHLTTEEEVTYFLKNFTECYQSLKLK